MFILKGPIARLLYTESDDDGGAGDDSAATDAAAAQAKSDFNAKYSARRDGVELPPEVKLQLPEKKEEIPDDKKPDEKPPLERKLPGGNFKKVLEDKRKAEAELAETRTRAEKFEKEEKPALEKKISDLEAKIGEGGLTSAEKAALQTKLDAAEAKLVEREESLVNENKALKSRLSYFDIQSDPDFRRTYVQPLHDHYAEAIDPIKSDERAMGLLQKALIANSSALGSTKPEERSSLEKERNTILSQISDSMDEFSRGQFTSAMNAYIQASKKHAGALGEHEKTKAQIMKEREDKVSREKTEIFSKWTKSSDLVAPAYDPDAAIDPELEPLMKELKLDIKKDLEDAGVMLKKAITGRASMEESLELLHRGRVYPAIIAKTRAQAKLISDLKATISKMRGTKAGGDPKDGSETATHKETRAEFNSRYSASRNRSS